MSVAPTLVFDLDGTLVETIGDIAGTLNVILGEEGCEPLPEERIRGMVGMGARVLLERGLAASLHPVTPAKLEALYARFLAHYAENIAVKSRPLAGLEEALDMAEAAGCRLAVCTNKLESLARKLLDELGLSHRFAAIVGGDTFPFQKPDPRVLLATIARAEGEPSVALMVGDSKTDVDTARAADIPVLVVDFGYTEIPPAELGGDALISSWYDFWEAATRLLHTRAAA
jgi:phosphoglycolate phosphatase